MEKATESRELIKASSVHRVLEIVGDRWVVVILQQCFLGIHGFEEFQRRLGIPRSTLSARLRMLVDQNVLSRVPSSTPNQRLDYLLTEKGRDLFYTALMALAWQQQWVPRFSQPAVKHLDCGHAMTPVMICNHCKNPIDAREVTFRDGPGASLITRSKRRRRRTTSTTSSNQALAVSEQLLDLVGDRWTPQVVALGFFGIRRFDDMQKTQKLASNILTDRLKCVVDMGIFRQEQYQSRPPRREYKLTEKGFSLYPMLMAMTQWGDRWCSGPEGPPLLFHHQTCGTSLKGMVVCSKCQSPVSPDSTQAIT